MSVQTTIKGIHVAGTQGPIPNTVGCLEAACRFWDPIANECSEVVKRQIMSEVAAALNNVHSSLQDLIEFYQKQEAEKNGDS